MSANSRIVWSPETGWADNGPESTLTLDERGRIAIEPTNYVITFADETSYLVEVSICPALIHRPRVRRNANSGVNFASSFVEVAVSDC